MIFYASSDVKLKNYAREKFLNLVRLTYLIERSLLGLKVKKVKYERQKKLVIFDRLLF